MQVFPVHEGDGDTGLTGTAGTTCAVKVGLVFVRNGVVDYVGHVINVNTSSSNIRSNEDLLLAGLELRHATFTLFLVEVTVHSNSREAAVGELFNQT